ncbi:ABC transporter permease [Ructibacterium gallinarum]|uniref:Sugar ABC transporter permease n=1 Tax=Ructibacterium gallinarum TaxID=2779355 RepID=A0A9D5R9E0_9FIRM|nr:ABC transporter permease subunit [Ructibacterium gallinarum]MBE5040932.1 sugar ABC transporter permease [Ructibacterium gallinarum]
MKTAKLSKGGAAHRRLRILHNTNHLQLYLMCVIPLGLFFVFSYLPMFGIVIAFKDYRFDKGIFGSEWVGFKNFEFFIKSNDFLRLVRNTLGMNSIFIVTGLIASITVALLLNEVRKRVFVKVYQTVLIVPYFLSWVVVGYMVYAFLNPEYGFINSVLRRMGGEAVSWYTEARYWPFILTLASVWKRVGMDSVIYFAALTAIDQTYYEAARIDGANKWQCMWHITLPGIRPVAITLTILAIGNIFRADFGLFYQVTRDVGSLYSTTDVMDTYVYRVMRSLGDMSLSSAAGLLQSMVGLVMVLLTNLAVRKIEPDSAIF